MAKPAVYMENRMLSNRIGTHAYRMQVFKIALDHIHGPAIFTCLGRNCVPVSLQPRALHTSRKVANRVSILRRQ